VELFDVQSDIEGDAGATQPVDRLTLGDRGVAGATPTGSPMALGGDV
jgi:hypothetical protein